jgi:hypothetical protein
MRPILITRVWRRISIHRLQRHPTLLHLERDIISPTISRSVRQIYHRRKVDFVDEVERWKIRWALVDTKSERLPDTLHAKTRDLYPVIYSIISILLTMLVSPATSERDLSAMISVKSYFRSTMSDELQSNLSLMHIHRCASRLGSEYWWLC